MNSHLLVPLRSRTTKPSQEGQPATCVTIYGVQEPTEDSLIEVGIAVRITDTSPAGRPLLQLGPSDVSRFAQLLKSAEQQWLAMMRSLRTDHNLTVEQTPPGGCILMVSPESANGAFVTIQLENDENGGMPKTRIWLFKSGTNVELPTFDCFTASERTPAAAADPESVVTQFPGRGQAAG